MVPILRAMRPFLPHCLALGLAAQAPAYRVSVDPWVAWGPALVAQDKGMWRQLGLDVEVVVYTANDSIHSFVAGRNDFVFAMAGTAVRAQLEQGVELTVLAEVDWSHGGDKILVRNGVEFAGAKGQCIGVYEDSPAVTMFLDRKLGAEGLRLADFRIVELTDLQALASQFAAGRLFAAVSYEPYVALATGAGACHVVATTADFPGIMPECIVARTPDLVRIPLAHVAALMAGWNAGVEWALDPRHRAEFERICQKRLFVDQKATPAQFADMLGNVRIHDRAALRARNVGDGGIRKALAECDAFARATRRAVRVEARPVAVDTRGLEQALGPAPAAAPAK
ncbi:MAG: ABC transporter substrate-binding protein [Planctomycetota bacterium]